MTKALIVTYSLNGTTDKVVAAIAGGLREAGADVDLHNLKDGPPPGPDGYDLLGVGSPTHFFRPPFNVTDYVDALQDLAGLPVFVFVLHGNIVGDGGNALRHALAGKGATEIGYFHCYGANNFLGYVHEGVLFSPGHPTQNELTQASAFGRDVASRMAGQPYAPPSDDPRPGWLYRVERFLLNRGLVENVYSRAFRVNRDACTSCGLCVAQCPNGNITLDAGGHPTWGRECLLCLNCEAACPQDAITSPVSWLLFKPAMMLNVRLGLGDPALDHVRVEHSRGRTRRV